jgi:hypothetical protein
MIIKGRVRNGFAFFVIPPIYLYVLGFSKTFYYSIGANVPFRFDVCHTYISWRIEGEAK